MGAKSQRKGRRGEQEIVRLAREHGLAALRTWELAQSPDPTERACDVQVGRLRCQVKLRRAGFAALYDGLQDVDALFVRRDGAEWLAVLPADRLLGMLNAAPTVRSQ